MDSRAILAGLLEYTDAKNIYTYTFGTPDTQDFDIGNLIPKNIGIKHLVLPLTDYTCSLDKLIHILKLIDKKTVLFHHGPVDLIKEYFGDYEISSGFIGDPLAGSHLRRIENTEKQVDEAKYNYINDNKYVRLLKLIYIPECNLLIFIEFPSCSLDDISLKEQLDFYNRQLKFIAPHVLMQGFIYKTPFLDQKWIDFIFM